MPLTLPARRSLSSSAAMAEASGFNSITASRYGFSLCDGEISVSFFDSNRPVEWYRKGY